MQNCNLGLAVMCIKALSRDVPDTPKATKIFMQHSAQPKGRQADHLQEPQDGK